MLNRFFNNRIRMIDNMTLTRCLVLLWVRHMMGMLLMNLNFMRYWIMMRGLNIWLIT